MVRHVKDLKPASVRLVQPQVDKIIAETQSSEGADWSASSAAAAPAAASAPAPQAQARSENRMNRPKTAGPGGRRGNSRGPTKRKRGSSFGWSHSTHALVFSSCPPGRPPSATISRPSMAKLEVEDEDMEGGEGSQGPLLSMGRADGRNVRSGNQVSGGVRWEFYLSFPVTNSSVALPHAMRTNPGAEESL